MNWNETASGRFTRCHTHPHTEPTTSSVRLETGTFITASPFAAVLMLKLSPEGEGFNPPKVGQ
jgi:hypothetical protein